MDLKDPKENKVMLVSPELVSLELTVSMEAMEIRETKERWVCLELPV